MKSVPRRARGFALILAVFLIVSLAAIGAYLLSVSQVQVASGVMDEQGARAYQAARAGLDWGAYRVLRGVVASCAPTTTITFPTVGPDAFLAGFYAEVKCTDYGAESEGGPTVNTYKIVSTGCNVVPPCGGTGATYVERQLQLTVAR